MKPTLSGARINASSGEVLGWIDLSRLASLPENCSKYQFTNGITADPERGSLLVTGKRWPQLFELKPLDQV
ncbi:MAG: glutaminyl-peptide cyclotransferase [bacterium]|nr:glutaminyl-peptide cyclotransferase [bacterium]